MGRIIGIISVVLTLSVLASCTDKSAMRQRLSYVSQCNRADTVFTEAWLPTVDSLVSYFDHHGNANEKMMAHYLKGRVHHDMGESPIALECYQKATEMADTAREDCDLYTLYAIYGQMAMLFHIQYLPDNELQALIESEQVAWKSKDTLNALFAYELRIRPFFLKNDTDSILSVTKHVRQLYLKYGYTKRAAWVCQTAIYLLTNQNRLTEAGEFLNIYEKESDLYDDNGNVASGREDYYVIKGNYLLHLGNLDSALVFFEKAVSHNLKEGGYMGLLSIYKMKHVPDSIAKYAELFANANDSSYLHVNQKVVHQINSMYVFQRHKKDSEQKRHELDKTKKTFAFFIACTAIIISLLILIYVRKKQIAERKANILMKELVALQFEIERNKSQQKHILSYYTTILNEKQQEEGFLLERIQTYEKEMTVKDEKYRANIDKLNKTQKEIINIKDVFTESIESKNTTINALEEKVDELTKELEKLSLSYNQNNFYETNVYCKFDKLRHFTKNYEPPSNEDWKDLLFMFSKFFSRYFLFISNGNKLTRDQLRVCVLLRLDFSESEMMLLMDKNHKQSITNLKSQINERLFGVKEAKILKSNLLPFF